MKTKQVNPTRLLPKTGKIDSTLFGDDGFYEAGWWKGRENINNKTRFIAKTIDGDDVVLDNATGLMWAADGNELGCNSGNTLAWIAGVQYAIALDFAGFTDWRLPNVNELVSLINRGLFDPAIEEPPFSNTTLFKYWSSTVNQKIVANAFWVGFDVGTLSHESLLFPEYIRCVRGGL